MRVMEIDNNPQKVILNLIKSAQKKFTTATLYGGNCGMFALAIGRILQKKGINVTLGFLIRDEDNEYNTLRDAQAAETSFYHVVIEHNGIMYDGDGIASVDSLRKLALDEYDDSHPEYLGKYLITDRTALSVIDNETNWSITAYEFQKKLK